MDDTKSTIVNYGNPFKLLCRIKNIKLYVNNVECNKIRNMDGDIKITWDSADSPSSNIFLLFDDNTKVMLNSYVKNGLYIIKQRDIYEIIKNYLKGAITGAYIIIEDTDVNDIYGQMDNKILISNSSIDIIADSIKTLDNGDLFFKWNSEHSSKFNIDISWVKK